MKKNFKRFEKNDIVCFFSSEVRKKIIGTIVEKCEKTGHYKLTIAEHGMPRHLFVSEDYLSLYFR